MGLWLSPDHPLISLQPQESWQPSEAGTHRKEGEPEHVVNAQSLELQDDRGQVAALHLRHRGLGQLLKVLLCKGEKHSWGLSYSSHSPQQNHTHFKFKLSHMDN